MSSGSEARVLLEGRLQTRPQLAQDFYIEGDRLVRAVVAGKHAAVTWVPLSAVGREVKEFGPAKAWSIAILRGVTLKHEPSVQQRLKVIDLFCGAGGFSAGLKSAAEAAGLEAVFAACVDLDPASIEVFDKNLRPQSKFKRNVDAMLDYALRYEGNNTSFAYPPEILEPVIRDYSGQVDIVVGGPPCQGHSNLNNHTRRTDLRNSLYLTVPAMGVAIGAKAIVIENVQAVLNDKGKVVAKARSILEKEYYVQDAILDAEKLGVAQQRKRHFLVATRDPCPPLKELEELLRTPQISTLDAIHDLVSRYGAGPFDSSAELSEKNRDRVRFLFENGAYDLPDAERPLCHQDGHTYPSVYGRMYPNRPSQTVTGGFLSPGRGRFVHPTEPRGLTPHEGARLQGFSDGFQFVRADGEKVRNKGFSKLIGDAVPPPLAYAVGLACIATL